LIEHADPNAARRAAILDAATGVFLRYGFKKTSMDDLARAAGLSRQGLYLHFATKEALFQEGLLRIIAATRAAGRAALARTELPVEERALEMFVAIHGQLIGRLGEHLSELMLTAKQLVGSAVDELEQEQVADLARLLRSEGVAAAWKDGGLSAKDLAEHLMAASAGIKHHVSEPGDYRARMRIAVQLVCQGRACARKKS
jgi:AcrR family transcriptional regulator